MSIFSHFQNRYSASQEEELTLQEYLDICKEMGIKALRGNQTNWVYKAQKEEEISNLIKGLRFIDRNFNISGHNSYSTDAILESFPFNFPASRFLYWYSSKLKFLEYNLYNLKIQNLSTYLVLK